MSPLTNDSDDSVVFPYMHSTLFVKSLESILAVSNEGVAGSNIIF